jgi:uncharacterized membrane protein YgdD (TMEM256/DUF423 family)
MPADLHDPKHAEPFHKADRALTAWGAGLLLLAVGLGAFGAHGLRGRIGAEALGQWRTAVEYQFYHGLGLLLLAGIRVHGTLSRVRTMRLLLVGSALFSGSLYLLSTRELTGWWGLTAIFGPMTPIGGLLLMAGWAVLLISSLRRAD